MRRYQPSFGLIAIGAILCLFLIASLVSHNRVFKSFDLVLRQVDAGVAIRDERRLFLDRETGIQGYAATGERLFLQPYNNAQANLAATSHRVRSALQELGLSDALELQQQIEALQHEWETTVAKNLLVNPHGVRANASELRGKQLMDLSRADFDRMLTIVRNRRTQTSIETRRFINYLLIASAVLTAALTIVGISLEVARSRLQAKLTATLEEQASYDAVTGLWNRRKFEELLRIEVLQAQRYDSKIAVMFLDLDGFKEVNDSLGHRAGDTVLKVVGRRLSDCLRETDILARLGGDEFTVMLPGVKDVKQVGCVAEKIVASIARPIEMEDGNTARVTASVGISVLSTAYPTGESLIEAADEAMYQSKRLGKNQYAMAS